LQKVLTSTREGVLDVPHYNFQWTSPLVGQSSPYPGDWYSLDARVEMALPSSLAYADLVSAPTFLPLDIAVAKAPSLDQEAVELSQEDGGAGFSNLQLTFTNAWQTQLFVYTTSVIPLLVVSALLLLRWRGRRPIDLYVGVAFGTLAALPIREVTVPPDVRTITRVDLLLGLALAMSAAGVLLSLSRRGDP
jgi:hypothetical protein